MPWSTQPAPVTPTPAGSYAFTAGLSLERCARIGNIAAAEVISHMGARPSSALGVMVHGA